jgi:imidazoleglycerol-phosphate dehydratase (EC 4.2.1.19)
MDKRERIFPAFLNLSPDVYSVDYNEYNFSMRKAKVLRETRETQIELEINLDGSGRFNATTPVGFLTHMVETFARHGRFDLELKAKGDVHVSHHHTVEDVGITLGMAVLEALGDKKGIQRYGYSIVPMDEALVLCSIDISGRPLFFYEDLGLRGKITDFDFELIWEFFKGFALESKSTLHIRVLSGRILHHIAEGCFKAFALALKQSVSIVGGELPSTKEKL